MTKSQPEPDPKDKQGAKHIKESGQNSYGERAEEVAWRVVYSELSKEERKKKE